MVEYQLIDTFYGEGLAGILKLARPLIDDSFWTESAKSMADRLRVARNVRIALQKELPDFFEGLDVDSTREGGEPDHACSNTFVDRASDYMIHVIHRTPPSTLEEHFAGVEDETCSQLIVTAGLTRETDMFPNFERVMLITDLLSDESLEEDKEDFNFDEALNSKTREGIGASIDPNQRFQIAYIFLEFITGDYYSLDECAVKVMNENRDMDFPLNCTDHRLLGIKDRDRTIYLANPTKQRRESFKAKVEALERVVEKEGISDVVKKWENIISYLVFGHLQYQGYLGQHPLRTEFAELARKYLAPVEEYLRAIPVPEEVKGIFAYQRDEEETS